MPTLANLSLNVEVFNKSHGTDATRYERKYWNALGGPFFPVRRYPGYPDHRVEYHKYFAPIMNIIKKAILLVGEDGIASDEDAVSDLIKGIAVGGTINVTMFSMNLEICYLKDSFCSEQYLLEA